MKQLSPLLIVLALLCTGCPRPLWLPDRNLKEYVTEQDVVGIWSLQPESLALLTRDEFKTNSTYQYNIRFFEDGSCSFHSVIAEFQGGDYCDVKGTWELKHDITGDSNVEKKNTVRIDLLIENKAVVRYLNFDKEDGALVLWQFYGDPDSWEFLEYKKKSRTNQVTLRDDPHRLS